MKTVETDAEAVEFCRKTMQEQLDRVDFDQPSVKDMLDSVGVKQGSREVQAIDVTCIGVFDLDLPPERVAHLPDVLRQVIRRQFVYRHRDGTLFALSVGKKTELRVNGSTRIWAFIVEDEGAAP